MGIHRRELLTVRGIDCDSSRVSPLLLVCIITQRKEW
nr:MAG TPA: hypothetical protein [Caudoviricetes sp.]